MMSNQSANVSAMMRATSSRPLSLSRSKVDYAVDSPFKKKNATWDVSAPKTKRSSKIVKTKSALLASLQEFRSEIDTVKSSRDAPVGLKKVTSFAA